MNSKECLNKILDMLNYEQTNECEKNSYLKIIRQDLDKLEKLENENQELKEKTEKTEKTIDEFLEHAQKNFRKYAKCKRTLDILKDSFEIVAVKEDWDGEYIIETKSYFVCINKEEYEILKEVLGND